MTILFRVVYETASLMDTIDAGSSPIEFKSSTFTSVINAGSFVGWVLSAELFLEDFDLPETDGEDIQIPTVKLLSLDERSLSVGLEVSFELTLSAPVEDTKEHRLNLFNAVSGAIMLCFWTGEGHTSHPDEGQGLYWFNGEMNLVEVNGHLVHNRQSG